MAVVISQRVEALPPVWTPPRAGLSRLRKIGFLGSHSASLASAPWDDPSWELLGHSSSRGWYKRPPERYFDLHRKACWTANHKGEKYRRWLAQNTVPIYMQARHAEVPAAVRYPRERVLAEFRAYCTNHVAWMIALALTEGVMHLGFFGVNYGHDTEYATQRGSCEYWMGLAEGRGVQLVIPTGSTLLNDPPLLYGYASHDEQGALVPAYRPKTTSRATPPAAVAVDAQGLEVPPVEIRDELARDLADHPPPPGYLGPREATQEATRETAHA